MSVKLNKNFRKNKMANAAKVVAKATSKSTKTVAKKSPTITKVVKKSRKDKENNLIGLRKEVETAFTKDKFVINTSSRISKFGGMLQVKFKKEDGKSTNTIIEVWDELIDNDRICIFTKEEIYNKFEKKLKADQKKSLITHTYSFSRQFFIKRDDISDTLKKIADITTPTKELTKANKKVANNK